MQLFFSTVVRGAPPRESGELVRLDWNTKEIVNRVPIFATDPELDDPNPRGNTRGGRGIARLGDRVLAASYHTLKVYDAKVNFQYDICHPLFVNIHEVFSCDEHTLLVSCTAIDAVLRIDLKTGKTVDEFWPREMPAFQERLQLTPLEIDKSVDNRELFVGRTVVRDAGHLHVNAAAIWDGDVYALFNSLGIIANLSQQEVVIEDPAIVGGHNLLIGPDGDVTVNDTRGHTVRTYDLRRREHRRTIRLNDYQWVRNLVRKHNASYFLMRILKKMRFHRASMARPLFVRGLDRLDNHYFVGVSPASILCIDAERGELVDAFCYSRDVRVCVHGLRAFNGLD